MNGPPAEESRPARANRAAPLDKIDTEDCSTTVDTTALRAALACARHGWPVFPCKPGAKQPATLHGFKDASTDPGVITRWWSRMPGANVAVATGAPAFDVLDVDVKADVDGLATMDRLKAAGLLAGALGIVRTPSGGLHVYFRGTRQGNGSLPGHGIDFRGLGGYVLIPPSTVDDAAYEVVDWRTDARGRALDWQACKRLVMPPRTTRLPHKGSRSEAVQNLARWLALRQKGNRNNALYWAANRAVEAGGQGEVDLLVDAAIQTGLSRREAESTVNSALRRAGGAS